MGPAAREHRRIGVAWLSPAASSTAMPSIVRPIRTSRTCQARGRASRGDSSRAPKPRAENHSSDASPAPSCEPPAAVGAVGVGDRAEQQHGVEVDVRVEPGEGGGGEHDRTTRERLRGAGRQRRRLRRALSSDRTPYAVRNATPNQRITSISPAGLLDDRSDARHPGDDQHEVGQRADRDDQGDVLASQSLPQHERVLRADRDDQRQAGQQSGRGGVEHQRSLGMVSTGNDRVSTRQCTCPQAGARS